MVNKIKKAINFHEVENLDIIDSFRARDYNNDNWLDIEAVKDILRAHGSGAEENW